jgi:EAL domain-containing protein (putative c-di-GMP-specific phosphodiesterase class I)
MGAEYVARVTLKAELREALAQAQFELYYQPKIDLESGSVIGCEALLRWNHPTLGLQAPGIFIPVAEQSGLIVPLGEWVVFEACRQSVRWRDAGLSPVPIAINLSPVQFHRSDVFEMLSNAFATTGASPGALDVEVTESVFINFSDDLVATLEKIRALGIEISLDDFGTGFSSLAYLTRLPLSIIKIDQTFVRGASENPSDAAIVRWVAQLAEELSLRVVAEGVETQEQLDFVRRAGCAEAQGYFFSRPVPAASFANLLKPAALVSASV